MLGLSACSGHGTAHAGAPASSTTHAAGTLNTVRVVNGPPPSPEPARVDTAKAPPLGESGTVLAHAAGMRGSASVAVLPRITKGTVVALVNCSGPGNDLWLDLGPLGKFQLDCREGAHGANAEAIELATPAVNVPVAVTGPATYRWSLTVALSHHPVRTSP